ncbi:MAG: M20 family metallo-hydrolase [Eubacteriales bacterium]
MAKNPIEDLYQANAMDYGQEINEKLDILGEHSAVGEGVTRIYLTPEHRSALDLLQVWMEEAGFTTTLDQAGNLIGEYHPYPDRKTLVMGSHQDTVHNGGKYDGALGIVLPLVCAGRLISREELPCNLTLIAFGDEEGVRFKTTFLGSMAYNGHLSQTLLERRDDTGQSLAEALTAFGCDPHQVNNSRPSAGDGYVEIHIEQGPVLEEEDLPVGIVTAIQSSSLYQVTLTGLAGHAGTVPMAYRQDPVATMAEALVALRTLALSGTNLVATVGEITVRPGSVNVIPGEVCFTIDIRSPEEKVIAETMATWEGALEEICGEQGTRYQVKQVNAIPATFCDQEMISLLTEACKEAGFPPYYLASGAGHDTQEMKSVLPVAMLFVRNRKGISHNPQEFVSVEDMERAAQVVTNLMRNYH